MSITIDEVVQFSVNLALQVEQKDKEIGALRERYASEEKARNESACDFCGVKPRGSSEIPEAFVRKWHDIMVSAWSGVSMKEIITMINKQ